MRPAAASGPARTAIPLPELVRALRQADLCAVDWVRQGLELLPDRYPRSAQERLRAHVAALEYGPALALLQEPDQGDAAQEPMESRHRILLVDDTPTTVLLLRTMLHGIGTLRFALGSDDALALADHWRPDVVLCDVHLDHRSGLDICRALKRGKSTDDPAVILMSAQNDVHSEVAALTAGADDFVNKPFQVARVLSRVHTQLSRRAREGAATSLGSIRLRPEILGFVTCSLAGRIIDMAPRLRRRLGVDLAEPVHAALIDFVPKPQRSDLRKRLLTCAQGGRMDPFEVNLIGPHAVVPARLTGWVAPGEHARVLWVSVEDLGERIISERRRIDSALARSISTLLGGIAHEFNNILAIAQGNLDMLLDAPPDRPPERARLERASQAVQRAIGITRSFGVAALRTPASPAQALDDLLRALRPLLTVPEPRAGDLVLQLDADKACLPMDRDGLRSVLQNLLDNAWEASDPHSPVVLRTYIERSDDGGATVVVEVEDHGRGMSEEIRSRALDPFFTTAAPRKRGLGLTEARGFVASHDGTLDLVSSPGSGTLVRMRFPLPS